MRLFRSAAPADLVAELRDHLGRTPRVLAHASGAQALGGGQVSGGAGLDQVLVLEDGLAVRRDGQWSLTDWQLVSSGDWKGDRRRLEWQLADQTRHHIVLDEPGRVPEVFQERVNASIVIQQGFDVPGGGRVIIAGRRALGESADRPVVWQAITQGSASLADPVVRQFVLDATATLRADYEF